MSKADPPVVPPLEALVEAADLAWFQVDAQRRLVRWSDQAAAITGFRREDVLGLPCVAAMRCRECLSGCGVWERGTIHEIPLALYGPDGREQRVLKSGKALRGPDGEITGAVEVFWPAPRTGGLDGADALLDALGRGALIVGADGRIRQVSGGFAAWLGAPAGSLVGRPVEALFADGIFAPDGPLARALAAGERREGWRATVRVADGGARPVSLSAAPLPAGGGYALMVRPDRATAGDLPGFEGMVARSAGMHRIFRLIDLLRDNDATVLVTGESGTGKELVARALHARSHRSSGPFVTVNCGALPGDLLESELFGHVRGAFTGAVRDRPGRVALAEGGTLFLDEVGDLPLPLQVKILRVLQERTYERVGESAPRTADVRVIAATHVDLARAVTRRDFREDLYYRLRVVPIELPPLRARREDIEPLATHLLDRIGQRRGRALQLSPSAMRALIAHAWPGNVRELENAVEYAVAVCVGQTIHEADLPTEVTGGPPPGAAAEQAAAQPEVTEACGPGPLSTDEEAERARVLAALEAAHWRRDEAAAALGMSRTTLWRKMKVLRIGD